MVVKLGWWSSGPTQPRQRWLWVTILALALVSRAFVAAASTDGLVLHALGFYAGKGDVSSEQIKCEVPTVDTAIPDGAFAMGLWNSYGADTLFFPDQNNPFANPCGGWLQLQSNLAYAGLNVDRVVVRLRVPGLRATWTKVPTRRSFPTACRALRQRTVRTGVRLDPALSTASHSSSGAPDVAFVPLRPLVPTGIIQCLREQYAGLPTEMFSSLSLVARVTAYGVDDLGRAFRSNPVSYTLNLRHVCGNGRVDDGEECDPSAPSQCGGACQGGTCSNAPGVACLADQDCVGTCSAQGAPTECTCAYGS